MQDVIAAKFDPPVWMGDQIRRDPLLGLLKQALSHRLTLVQAPAGYGKTSLLAQWRNSLESTSTGVAWLTLERDDRDLKRFVNCLSLSIDGSEQNNDRRALSTDLPTRSALSAIIKELGHQSHPFVIILDDLHHADSQPVLDFLRSLIRMAPSNCHFVFASRDYLELGQSVLTAEEQFIEITAKELKFSATETESLLVRSETPLAKDDISKILDHTEGWPIAVQLTSLSMKRRKGHESVSEEFSGSGTDLARYLSDQVLMTLPDETREIVLRTSLLDRLTGDLVNLLCDRQDGWLVLENLERQGVFLTPVSADREEYRYHQLFAEFLRDRFERSDSEKFSALQLRIAQWFADQGKVAEAVNHAMLADNDKLLADIIVEAGGWRLIPQGLQGVVERGLSTLSDKYIRSRPRVVLVKVYLLIKLGELGAARTFFDSFTERAKEMDLSAELKTDIRVVGDTLADYENQIVSLDDLIAREALLRKLPADDHLVLAHISETLGAKYFEGGWLERALQPVLAAREHYQMFGSVYSDLFTQFLEARIKRAQGRSKEAATILRKAWEKIVENFGDQSDLAANCAAFQAELLYEEDNIPDARALLDWALPHMEQSDAWVDVYSAAYFTEARLLAGEGALDEARAVVARAKRVASRRRLRQLELLADVFEIELHLAYGGDVDSARKAAESVNLDQYTDIITEDVPHYRPVVLAAALCRVKIRLLDGNIEAAMADIENLRAWANQRGAGRLLIDINILAAFGYRAVGAIAESKACFDDAVGIAMFQGIARPFIDARQFVQPCLEEAMSADTEVDRFRGQFLKSLAKSITASRNTDTVLGLFTEAEAEVLYYLSKGHSNKEIARLIGMSPDTVKYRLKSVFRKIGVSKRRDAVRISAERWNLPAPIASINVAGAELSEQ